MGAKQKTLMKGWNGKSQCRVKWEIPMQGGMGNLNAGVKREILRKG